ncbi:hypothetical protein HK104_001233 [Borealophlyctis nickersoniae]|nr:hypothetical protein HK104_001233 [Borealophlyctis nickersoniae]
MSEQQKYSISLKWKAVVPKPKTLRSIQGASDTDFVSTQRVPFWFELFLFGIMKDGIPTYRKDSGKWLRVDATGKVVAKGATTLDALVTLDLQDFTREPNVDYKIVLFAVPSAHYEQFLKWQSLKHGGDIFLHSAYRYCEVALIGDASEQLRFHRTERSESYTNVWPSGQDPWRGASCELEVRVQPAWESPTSASEIQPGPSPYPQRRRQPAARMGSAPVTAEPTVKRRPKSTPTSSKATPKKRPAPKYFHSLTRLPVGSSDDEGLDSDDHMDETFVWHDQDALLERKNLNPEMKALFLAWNRHVSAESPLGFCHMKGCTESFIDKVYSYTAFPSHYVTASLKRTFNIAQHPTIGHQEMATWICQLCAKWQVLKHEDVEPLLERSMRSRQEPDGYSWQENLERLERLKLTE